MSGGLKSYRLHKERIKTHKHTSGAATGAEGHVPQPLSSQVMETVEIRGGNVCGVSGVVQWSQVSW